MITKFSGWVDLLTHGAPQARFARRSSAIIIVEKVTKKKSWHSLQDQGSTQSHLQSLYISEGLGAISKGYHVSAGADYSAPGIG